MSAREFPSLRDFRSALIVKPSSLGDIVHTLPAVRAIHQAHPHLQLRWIANPEWMPLLEGVPMLTEVTPFPRKQFRGLKILPNALRWAPQWRRLPREMPEIVLDFQGLLRSALISRSRGSRPIVGLSDAREGGRWFQDHTVAVDARAHAVDRYLAMPRAFGITVDAAHLHFPLPPGRPPAGWPQRDDLILIHPWSRGIGKSLEVEALQALCDALAPRPVVIVGVTSTPVPLRGDHITDFSNRTSLAELIWVLRQARFCISVDSGPMHIAAAVNDRTLGLHTWSDPRKVGPYNPRAWVWKAGRIAHRTDFSDAECRTEATVTAADARAIAAFVHADRENR
ncbi:MAG TPA: glycosyltransferase family 9 protein [Prosthecobacter sp.]|nr:glycosyltransferase family 9 protein [Prosthecobacter sp.]